MNCPKCGTELPDNTTVCTNCGEELVKTNEEVKVNNEEVKVNSEAVKEEQTGFSITGFILSIASIILVFINPIVSIICLDVKKELKD